VTSAATGTPVCKKSTITLIINGDLIETFTGLNHINSWKNIDKKYGYGTKAIEPSMPIVGEVTNILLKGVPEVVIGS
jgi:hypothetical protein